MKTPVIPCVSLIKGCYLGSLPHVIYCLKQFSSPNSNVCGIPTPSTQIQDPCWSQWPYVLGNCVRGNMFWEICVFYFHSSVFIFYTYIPSLSSNQSRHVNYLRNFHKKLVIPNISHTKHLNFVNIWSEEYHIQLYQFLPSNIFIPPPLLHFIPFPWAALLLNINAMENYSLSRSYFQITYSKYEELGK